MAQVKLLKISSEGLPQEFDVANDEITLTSFTVNGGGPVLSSTGLDLNNTDLSDVSDISFNDPAVGTINSIIANDLMSQAKENAMAAGAAVLFPVVTDDAGELDAFRLPAIAGTPSATPADGGEGYLVWDSSGNKMYAWNGSAWDDLSSVSSANNLIMDGFVADGSLAARDAVYISAADKVKKAKGDDIATSRVVGFSVGAYSDTDPAQVFEQGVMSGFSSLTAAAEYFLSAATAGAITATPPSGVGHVVTSVGIAKSTTELLVKIGSPVRRA